MKRLLLAAALAAVAASSPGVAEARDTPRHDRHDRHDRHHKADRDYWKDRQKAERRALKDYEKAVREEQKAYRRWARGQRLPVEYRQPRYYVQDYPRYGLTAPPAGYTYVRPYPADDTYYMIELASGLISTILGE